MLVAIVSTLAGVILTGLFVFGAYLVKKLGELDTKISVVEAQHQNNGGSTMKDAVDRIERKLDRSSEKLQDHLIEAAADHTEFRNHVAACGTTVVVHPPVPPVQ